MAYCSGWGALVTAASIVQGDGQVKSWAVLDIA